MYQSISRGRLLIAGLVLAAVGVWVVGCALFQSSSNIVNTQQEAIMPLENSPFKFKVILIVLDAFRYDYSQRTGLLRNRLKDNPTTSRLVKIRAESPTMTTERIQSMMSGTELSHSFVFSSFLSEKSQTDAIPWKVRDSLLLGDDTWGKLYNFSKAVTCRSFDVADLDTCDNIVMDNLGKESHEYELVVGHMLGLDHIGHTYSSISVSKMSEKLMQLQQFIDGLIERLDNKTVLFVAGDHGMKADGNHGGASDQQRYTSLYCFTKSIPLVKLDQAREFELQTSLAPTLAVLLNVTLPTENLAQPLYSMLPEVYLPSLAVIDQNIQRTIQTNLRKRNIDFVPGQESKAVEDMKPPVSQTMLLAGVTVLVFSATALCFTIRITVLEVMMVLAVPLCNFSWGALRNMADTQLAFLLGIVWVATCKDSKNRSLVSALKISAMCLLLVQMEPTRASDEFTNSSVAVLSRLLVLPIVHTLMIIGVAIRMVYRIYTRLATVHGILQLLLIAITTILTLYNSPCLTKNIAIVFNVAVLFLPNISADDRRVYMQLLATQFGGPKALVIYYLQTQIQHALFSTLQKRSASIGSVALAKLVWIVFGNRPQFSCIDVKRSYVLSNSFSPLANGLSLWMYLMGPYLIALTDCSRHKGKEQQGSSSVVLVVLVSLLNSITTCLALHHNIGKILYTVIYLPMAVFNMGELVSLVLIGFLLIISWKANNRNPNYFPIAAS